MMAGGMSFGYATTTGHGNISYAGKRIAVFEITTMTNEDKTNSELTSFARGVARMLTYNDEPEGAAKRVIHALCRRIDSQDIRIVRLRGKWVLCDGLGKQRPATRCERFMWHLCRALPHTL